MENKLEFTREIEAAVSRCVSLALSGFRKATAYLTPTLTVKATRRFKPAQCTRITEIILTIGKPNSKEREYIKRNKALIESAMTHTYIKVSR